jgi:hypothetical protein
VATRAETIRKLVSELKIPFLIHFTRVENLQSIIQHGLWPVARIGEIGVKPQINDQHRIDGHLEATSLSVAFPNYRMFYKYRMENKNTDWVVLGIDPAVLWKKECAFCKHNAADSKITCQSLPALKSAESFKSMFEEIDGRSSRTDQKLKEFYPTDEQAEVLVFEVIEPKYICGVSFDTSKKDLKGSYEKMLGDRQILVSGFYFHSRSYNR